LKFNLQDFTYFGREKKMKFYALFLKTATVFGLVLLIQMLYQLEEVKRFRQIKMIEMSTVELTNALTTTVEEVQTTVTTEVIKIPTLLIGLPTVKRNGEEYLSDTLNYLLEDLSGFTDKFSQSLQINILLYAGGADDNYANELKEKYDSEEIQIVAAPKEYYGSDLTEIKHNWGDSDERIIWRTRQCLDYLFMWNIGKEYDYFLQLEDDVQIDRGFLEFVRMQIEQKKDDPDWIAMEFSEMGFIGKLFRRESLEKLIIYTKLFYRVKPIDLIYWAFVGMQACLPEYRPDKCRPLVAKLALRFPGKKFLHHMGRVSSLDGKISHLGDTNPSVDSEKLETNLNKEGVLQFYNGQKELSIPASTQDASITLFFSHLQSPLKLIIESDSENPISDHPEIQLLTTAAIKTTEEDGEVWTKNPVGLGCAADKLHRGKLFCDLVKLNPEKKLVKALKINIPCRSPVLLKKITISG